MKSGKRLKEGKRLSRRPLRGYCLPPSLSTSWELLRPTKLPQARPAARQRRGTAPYWLGGCPCQEIISSLVTAGSCSIGDRLGVFQQGGHNLPNSHPTGATASDLRRHNLQKAAVWESLFILRKSKIFQELYSHKHTTLNSYLQGTASVLLGVAHKFN